MTRATGYLFPTALGRAPHKGLRTAPATRNLMGLPEVVDLGPAMPPVYDQGWLGSCVAQALAGAVEYLLPRAGASPERPSRLALYWQSRRRIGTLDEDSGAILGDGIESLRVEGWAPEELWPYAPGLFVETPPPATLEAGRRRRLVSAEPLDWDADTLRWELACGHAVVAGIRCYRSLQDVGSDGVIPDPEGRATGGHAVLLCGYDRAAGRFRLRNSWGSSWGQGGYGWISQNYVTDPAECGELWSLRVVRVLP